MARMVWIDSWQMQCCGEPFAVGDEVPLSVTSEVDTDFLSTLLGPERASTIALAEDHHDVTAGEPSTITGVVRSIEAVSSPLEPRDGALHPVPGAARITALARADGWEPEPEGWSFFGYVVSLDRAASGRRAGRAS